MMSKVIKGQGQILGHPNEYVMQTYVTQYIEFVIILYILLIDNN